MVKIQDKRHNRKNQCLTCKGVLIFDSAKTPHQAYRCYGILKNTASEHETLLKEMNEESDDHDHMPISYSWNLGVSHFTEDMRAKKMPPLVTSGATYAIGVSQNMNGTSQSQNGGQKKINAKAEIEEMKRRLASSANHSHSPTPYLTPTTEKRHAKPVMVAPEHSLARLKEHVDSLVDRPDVDKAYTLAAAVSNKAVHETKKLATFTERWMTDWKKGFPDNVKQRGVNTFEYIKVKVPEMTTAAKNYIVESWSSASETRTNKRK
jgi:hypothetical protein